MIEVHKLLTKLQIGIIQLVESSDDSMRVFVRGYE